MAKLIIVLDIPGKTVDELKQDVVDWDAQASTPADAIRKEAVTASTVASLLYTSYLGYENETTLFEELIEDEVDFEIRIGELSDADRGAVGHQRMTSEAFEVL